jgi:hypothetical protein
MRNLRGQGDLWIVEGAISYGGGPWQPGVNILELRGDKVARETIYVTEHWDPRNGVPRGGRRRSVDVMTRGCRRSSCSATTLDWRSLDQPAERTTENLAEAKSPFRPSSSRRSSRRRGSRGAPPPSVTGAIDTMISSSRPASAN